jgi:hypothetical protein
MGIANAIPAIRHQANKKAMAVVPINRERPVIRDSKRKNPMTEGRMGTRDYRGRCRMQDL